MPTPVKEKRPWKQLRASSDRWATQLTHRFTITFILYYLYQKDVVYFTFWVYINLFSHIKMWVVSAVRVLLLPVLQIQVLPEGGETPMFKQFFRGWKDRDQSEGFGKVFVSERIARIQQVEFDASKLHESHHMAAQYNMVDDGRGDTQVKTLLMLSCWHGYSWRCNGEWIA